MIKVKDGYVKLIGTTYQGSATQVLLSNGGDLEYSASSKASTLVQRNASQHIYATYFNSAISDEALTDIGSVYVRNTSDTFIRRVSKTQFYSILDDKFVTLDTTQSITGAKTFSTSVRFANNASIIQNQNDTSNYTTILKWYKNGASRNTYDPSIGQHNTGGDGNGSICILPYPTETSPWGGTVGLFISKGVLKLDGKSVALAENYYTKTESDERYVNVTGDTMTGPLIVKAAITGTQLISTIATGTSPFTVSSTTVVGNLNADMVDGYHSSELFRSFGGVSIDFNFSDDNDNNGLYYLHPDYTQSNKNGITYGSLMNFSSGASSWQIISGNDARLYYRNRWWSRGGGAWSAWKTIAYTSDIKDFAKGNAGASNRGVYVTNGTVTAMTYYLNATVNSGASSKLAYYSGTNSIDDYTRTVGSSGTPIYLSGGVPTACTGVMVKYWASYTITNYSGTSVTYLKNGGNYNFVTSTSRRDTGRYTIGTVYPSGQTWRTTLVWAVGNLNASYSNSSYSLLYCTLIRGYHSGSTYYWYANIADDASTNNGSFELFFLCF